LCAAEKTARVYNPACDGFGKGIDQQARCDAFATPQNSHFSVLFVQPKFGGTATSGA
jgi:hypothetical protein